MSQAAPGEEHPLLALLKEVVDGLGTLLAGHVRLARVELAGDVAAYGRRAGLVALAAGLALVGYGLACVAASLALARVIGAPLAFLAVGGAHLAGAGIALAWLLSRTPAPVFSESASELTRTVTSLTAIGPTAAARRAEIT